MYTYFYSAASLYIVAKYWQQIQWLFRICSGSMTEQHFMILNMVFETRINFICGLECKMYEKNSNISWQPSCISKMAAAIFPENETVALHIKKYGIWNHNQLYIWPIVVEISYVSLCPPFWISRWQPSELSKQCHPICLYSVYICCYKI